MDISPHTADENSATGPNAIPQYDPTKRYKPGDVYMDGIAKHRVTAVDIHDKPTLTAMTYPARCNGPDCSAKDGTGHSPTCHLEHERNAAGSPVHLAGDNLNYGTSDGKGGLVPPPIDGRRKLSATDLQLLNRIKELGYQAQLLEEEVKFHINCNRDEAISRQHDPAQPDDIKQKAKEEEDRINKAEPFRHIALFKTHFQEAAMHLSRAVAQPSTYA